MAIAPEDRIRQVTATPKTTAKPKATPKSSVPTTPVNKNLPAPVDPTPNRAVLDPTQYPMAEITTTTGEKVMVYTGGPLAGQDKNGNIPIQASAQAPVTGEGDNGGKGKGGKSDTYTATDGTVFTDKATYDKYQELLADKTALSDTKRRSGESAYNILYKKFSEYGLGSLVQDVESYIKDGLSEDELTLRLRETPAYQTRFAANKQRIAKGLAALNEAEYIKMEDQYQEVMRQYGLPESYWSKDKMGTQAGFEQLLANDVSNTELEDRLVVAQDRVLKSAPEIADTLRKYYPEITNGDILAYTLDPKNAIKDIQRKVTAAEIGGFAAIQGLEPVSVGRAEELVKGGVTGQEYQTAAPTISEASIRGGQLASIYGENPYTQQTAESAVLNVGNSAEAIRQTKKLTALEQAAFSGQSGRGVLARERSGSI